MADEVISGQIRIDTDGGQVEQLTRNVGALNEQLAATQTAGADQATTLKALQEQYQFLSAQVEAASSAVDAAASSSDVSARKYGQLLDVWLKLVEEQSGLELALKRQTEAEQEAARVSNAPAGAGPAQVTETAVQATAAVAKLTDQMALVGQVAKAYGVSGAEASRLVAEQVEHLNQLYGQNAVSVETYAKELLAYAQQAAAALQEVGTAAQKPLTLPEQQKVVAGGQYVTAWQEMLGQMDAAYTEFWVKAGNTEQEALVKSAQATQEYEQLWLNLLQQRDSAEQEEVVRSAQRAQEYVQLWEKLLQNQAGPLNRSAMTAGGGNIAALEDEARIDQLLVEMEQRKAQALQGGGQALQQILDAKNAELSVTQQQVVSEETITKAIEQQLGLISSAEQAIQDATAAQARFGGPQSGPLGAQVDNDLQDARQRLAEATARLNVLEQQRVAILAQSTEATVKATQTTDQWNLNTEKGSTLTGKYTQLLDAYMKAGMSTAEATQAINKAEADGLSTKEALNQADQMRQNNMRQLTESGMSRAAAERQLSLTLRQEGEDAKQTAQTEAELNDVRGSSIYSARQAGQAFFGLTIASFGLMEVERQLKAQSSDLVEPLDKLIGLMRTTSALGSAGAFLGPMVGIGGPMGAGIGAVAGVLLDLPELLDKTSDSTKKLVQALGQIDTKPAQALSELARVSLETANNMLKVADTEPAVKKALDDLAAAQKAQENFRVLPYLPVSTDYKGETQGVIDQANANLQLQYALSQTRKEFADLQAQLDPVKDKFRELTGVTQDQESAVLKYAEANPRAAQSLREVLTQLETERIAQIQDAEHASEHTQKLSALESQAHRLASALYDASQAEKEFDKASKDLAKAEDDLSRAFEQADHALAQLNERTANQRSAAQQQFTDTSADAVRTYNQAVASAEQQKTDRIADINQQTADKVVDLWAKEADKEAQIQLELSNRLADIQTNLAQRLFDIETQLGNKIADAQQQLRDKLSDLAHSYQQKLDSINQQIVDQAQQTAEKLYQIERDRVESLERLGFETHEQLEGAKTDHDRARIMEKAQFEAAQINQRANDQTRDAEASLHGAEVRAKRERELALQNYEYEKALAVRQEQEAIARAEREAAQQRAIALREAAQQIAIAQRTAQQQTDAARAELDRELFLAHRQADEQIAQAVRAAKESEAAALQAEKNKLSDAQRALDEKNKAIDQSYKMELEQIEYTRQKAIDAYNDVLKVLAQLLDVNLQFMRQLAEIAAAEHQFAQTRGQSPVGGGQFEPRPVGGQVGLDFVVPRGYNGDSFPFRASSGERVQITPPGGSHDRAPSGAPGNIVININGANDPAKTAEAVRKVLQQEAMRWSSAYA